MNERGEPVYEAQKQDTEKNKLNELREMSENQYYEKAAEIGNKILSLAKEGKLDMEARKPRDPNSMRAKDLERKKERINEINTQEYQFENDGTARVFFVPNATGEVPGRYIRLRPKCEEEDDDPVKFADAFGEYLNINGRYSVSPYIDLETHSIYSNLSPEDQRFFSTMKVKAKVDGAIRKYQEAKKISDDLEIDLENPEIFKQSDS